MGQPQVHVTLRAERDQHPVLGAVQSGEPEHRQPLGQLEVDGAGGQVGQCGRQPLVGDGTPSSARSRRNSSACQARSIRKARPAESTSSPARQRAEQLGPLRAVPSEQVGRSSGGQPPPAATRTFLRAATQVAPQQLGPGVVAGSVEDREDRPHRPRGLPGIASGVDLGDRCQRVGHQPPDGREVDAGTDPEPVGHLLGQPALHAAGGHGHDLGGERVRQRLGQQVGQSADQPVGPLGAVQVETHGGQSLDITSDSDGGVTDLPAGNLSIVEIDRTDLDRRTPFHLDPRDLPGNDLVDAGDRAGGEQQARADRVTAVGQHVPGRRQGVVQTTRQVREGPLTHQLAVDEAAAAAGRRHRRRRTGSGRAPGRCCCRSRRRPPWDRDR